MANSRNLFGRILDRLLESRVERRITEITALTGYGFERDPSDPKDVYYRRLSRAGDKELSALTFERMLKLAFYLYEHNPLAHRIIELTKDFVIGTGIVYKAEEPVKTILDEHWYHPLNNWPVFQHNAVLELSLYGEQIYPVEVNPVSGLVYLGYVDPLNVKEVVVDPKNSKIAIGLVLKDATDKVGPKYRVILPGGGSYISEEAKRRQGEFSDGDCFYFAINKVSNSTRGRSDLLPLIDWLDGYDELLFNRIDRSRILNNYMWDVTLDGMNIEEIKLWLKENLAPKPGSIRAHNEKVKWTAITPQLQASDASTEARLLRNHIIGTAGFPEHWFGEGGEVNRAVGAEMGTPTYRRLLSRQHYFKSCLEVIFDYQLRKAQEIANSLKGVNLDDLDIYKVIMDEVSARDISTLSRVLRTVTETLRNSIETQTISRKEARKIYAAALEPMGYEVTLDVSGLPDFGLQLAAGDNSGLSHVTHDGEHSVHGNSPTKPNLEVKKDA